MCMAFLQCLSLAATQHKPHAHAPKQMQPSIGVALKMCWLAAEVLRLRAYAVDLQRHLTCSRFGGETAASSAPNKASCASSNAALSARGCGKGCALRRRRRPSGVPDQARHREAPLSALHATLRLPRTAAPQCLCGRRLHTVAMPYMLPRALPLARLSASRHVAAGLHFLGAVEARRHACCTCPVVAFACTTRHAVLARINNAQN